MPEGNVDAVLVGTIEHRVGLRDGSNLMNYFSRCEIDDEYRLRSQECDEEPASLSINTEMVEGAACNFRDGNRLDRFERWGGLCACDSRK
jgi:IS1 family transposase